MILLYVELNYLIQLNVYFYGVLILIITTQWH